MKLLLCAATLCLAPSLAMATPSGETIGTFFDPGATQTSLTVAPMEIFNIYFIAEDVPAGISGYEFYVNMPPELLILSVTAHPVAFNTLDIDPSNEGFIVGIGGTCLSGAGPIVLAEFSCMSLQTAAGLEITIGPSNPSSFGGTAPGYAECSTLALFPFADAYVGPATVDVIEAATCQWYCGTGANATTDGYVINSPAVLGGALAASVTGCDAASVGAFLVAYSSPLTLATGWGEILVNIADPNGELLGMPSSIGSPAIFTLPVPNDPIFAGFDFYTQAGSFGGSLCLHCGYACTVGS